MSKNELDAGINIIKKISKELPKRSGVYKMISLNNEVLYIGKAKNNEKRVVELFLNNLRDFNFQTSSSYQKHKIL